MATFTEYAQYDALGLAALISNGDVGVDEVLAAAVERAEALDPELNAFTHFDAQTARDALPHLPQGPFHGVPFAVKDLWLAWAGAPHSAGSRFVGNQAVTADAPLAAAMRATGLVSLGKTNTPEFGITGTTEPARFGATRNPWDTRRIAGGSSGGSAAAVAAGIVPMAHASDGAGSIRIPAACCGLVGLMPSRGRAVRSNAALDVPFGFSRNFIVSRSVRDSAAMLDAVADRSAYAPPRPDGPWLSDHALPPAPLRIAASAATPSGRPVDEQISRALQQTMQVLEGLGHVVEERSLQTDWRQFYRAFGTIGSSQLAADLLGLERELGREADPAELEPLTWRNVRGGRKRTAMEAIEALRILQALTRDAEDFFTDVDVLVTPVLGTPLPEVGYMDPVAVEPSEHDKRSARTFPFTPPFNATGQPAISLPMATDREGLPIGMQFVGRYGDELTLLQLAAQLEEAVAWDNRRGLLQVGAVG